MLKCFPFRYEVLREDDSVRLSFCVGKKKYVSNRLRTSSTSSSTTSTERSEEAGTSKKTKHLDRQQRVRKVSEAIDHGQRYSRFPLSTPTTLEPRTTNTTASGGSNSDITTKAVAIKSGSALRSLRLLNKMPRTNEWSLNGSFLNKPSRGWLHPDKQLTDDAGGVSYSVRYVGCLAVNASMKSLEFETRSQVAKECINRICEVAGLKTVDRRRRVEKKIARMLGEKPNMEHAGSNVNLHISSAHLKLVVMETDQVIVSHDMPNVSFASGGDPETLDFVSYVAKNESSDRACYVLECGGGLAQDVITTIGQAFELRFKEYLEKNVLRELPPSFGVQAAGIRADDPEYYNDLPGKMPPEPGLPTIPPWPDYQNDQKWLDQPQHRMNGNCRDSIDNLIDLSSEPSSPLTRVAVGSDYVNNCIALSHRSSESTACNFNLTIDPFDMQPFEENLPADVLGKSKNSFDHHAHLVHQDWFHGTISRKTAEALLVHDGDFLVRESRGSPGQFILSGLHKNQKKHLLLVDPEGMVRTKDRKFESVAHLVEYHQSNRLPIISAESALILQTPISKSTTTLR